MGAWLAVLACGVQVLLPFLVAIEIRAASLEATHHHAPAAVAASHVHGDSQPFRHKSRHGTGLAGGCPICLALSVAQAFTAPAPLALPLPQVPRLVRVAVAAAPPPAQDTPAHYEARAPPTLL